MREPLLHGALLNVLPLNPLSDREPNAMKVYGYVRVSTADQALGVKAQDDSIRRYAAFKGWKLTNIFTDEAVSGKHPLGQRPRGSALLKALEEGDHLIVHKLDRAWRSSLDCLETVHAFREKGVTLHIVDMGVDLSTPHGKLVVTVMAAFAEMEREMISIRTKEGLAKSDKPKGPQSAPYGSLPGERKTLKRIKEMHEAGWSTVQIARLLPAKTSRSGKPWDRKTIGRILKREQ